MVAEFAVRTVCGIFSMQVILVWSESKKAADSNV